MSEQFQKGQLVAVRLNNESPWEVARFVSMFNGLHEVQQLGSSMKTYWKDCRLLEDVWDGTIFLEREMAMIDRLWETMAHLSSQIDWLCKVLENRARDEEGEGLCPRGATCDGKKSCAFCWRRASRIATREVD